MTHPVHDRAVSFVFVGVHVAHGVEMVVAPSRRSVCRVVEEVVCATGSYMSRRLELHAAVVEMISPGPIHSASP